MKWDEQNQIYVKERRHKWWRAKIIDIKEWHVKENTDREHWMEHALPQRKYDALIRIHIQNTTTNPEYWLEDPEVDASMRIFKRTKLGRKHDKISS